MRIKTYFISSWRLGTTWTNKACPRSTQSALEQLLSHFWQDSTYQVQYIPDSVHTRFSTYQIQYLPDSVLTRFSTYQDQYIPGSVQTRFSTYKVQYIQGSVHTRFSTNEYIQGSVHTRFSTYKVQYIQGSVHTRFSTYQVQYIPDSVNKNSLKSKSRMKQSWPFWWSDQWSTLAPSTLKVQICILFMLIYLLLKNKDSKMDWDRVSKTYMRRRFLTTKIIYYVL